jgi:hypothetical protein
MKKMRTIGLLLVLSLLLAPAMQIIIANADTEQPQNTAVSGVSFAPLPLSNSQISTIWPNLPSAQTLLNSNTTFIFDSAEYGQIASSGPGHLPIPPNPTGHLLPFTVTNYTAYVPNTCTGAAGYEPSTLTNSIILVPSIWLQIDNSTRWIEVPINLLLSTNQTDIPAPAAPSVSTGTQSSSPSPAQQ